MFELPEFVTLARQMNEPLTGKTIRKGSLGNAPHKFVWYNKSHDEFERLTRGKTVGEARAKGKWLFPPEPRLCFAAWRMWRKGALSSSRFHGAGQVSPVYHI
jgi:hypothetical protein